MATEPLALLERVARHISETLYDHSGHIGDSWGAKHGRNYITHDDMDELRLLAMNLKAQGFTMKELDAYDAMKAVGAPDGSIGRLKALGYRVVAIEDEDASVG